MNQKLVTVPDLVGMSKGQGKRELKRLGLKSAMEVDRGPAGGRAEGLLRNRLLGSRLLWAQQ
jgi:beta-lactam-binding protein with PASTA domain